jgi:two-component system NarL family sensor kinase
MWMQASTARDRFATGAVVTATGLSLVSAALGVVLDPSPLRLLVAVGVLAFLSVPLVGAAAVRAGAGGVVGWLMVAAGLALPVAAGGYLYSGPAYERNLPGATLAAWLDGWLWVPALVLVPTVGLLLLPDGTAPSRRSRPLLAAALLVAGAITLSLLFGTELLDYPDKANPTALPGLAGQVANGLGIAIAFMGPLTTAIAISLGRRRRGAGDTPTGRALGLVVPASWVVAASWWACLVIAVAFDSDLV